MQNLAFFIINKSLNAYNQHQLQKNCFLEKELTVFQGISTTQHGIFFHHVVRSVWSGSRNIDIHIKHCHFYETFRNSLRFLKNSNPFWIIYKCIPLDIIANFLGSNFMRSLTNKFLSRMKHYKSGKVGHVVFG